SPAQEAWRARARPARIRALTPADIQDLSLAEMEAWAVASGEAPYRARQILGWVHRKGAPDFAAMSDLSRGLRARLAETFGLGRLEPTFVAEAADGTRRMLFHLPADGRKPAAAIESVLIPQT